MESSSSSSSIELKLISCKDLRAFNFFQKLTLYALVSIESNDPTSQLTEEQKQQQRTPTYRDTAGDGDGGNNPEWNHEVRFDLGFLSRRRSSDSSGGDLFFRFEFRHDGVILGDKLIGECRVPLADLFRDSTDGVARFVCYEVRSGDGKPNGIFNFSYRLRGIGNGTHSSQILDGRVSGYPVLSPEDYAPNNQSQVVPMQYPSPEIYPMVCSVPEGPLYPPVAVAEPVPPPYVSSPTAGDYHYYYPPPPPPPCPYPPPPPPVAQLYPPHIGPGAHHWPSGPYFEHRW